MWGEIHKSPNMISLYHFNEGSGTTHSDEMENYDLTSGNQVQNSDSNTKTGYSILTTPPNNNSYQGNIYTTVSNSAIDYQDIEGIRTIGLWCLAGYSDSVYRSYGETLIHFQTVTTTPISVRKNGSWDGSHLEDTFTFSYSLEIYKSGGGHSTVSFTSDQDYSYSKPYFIILVFKPSDEGTANGYIDFYVNFVKIDRQTDPGSSSDRWQFIYTASSNRYLYISASSTNPQANTIFYGFIDEIFFTSDVLSDAEIKNIKREWKGSFIF